MNKVVQYLIRVGDATSQLVNTAVLFSDNPNESISGRAYRLNDEQVWKQTEKTINFIFQKWDEDHCKQAFLNDLGRARKLLGAEEDSK
jgi:hypothetical protein